MDPELATYLRRWLFMQRRRLRISEGVEALQELLPHPREVIHFIDLDQGAKEKPFMTVVKT